MRETLRPGAVQQLTRRLKQLAGPGASGLSLLLCTTPSEFCENPQIQQSHKGVPQGNKPQMGRKTTEEMTQAPTRAA
ncbi:hypothetical protein cyc_03030 [Cyclospora cayetanensis]|uniref:Uncharacterized protein n=1 Tax=Cyclospora cayetanensis TaxID=88456 RepID=A0A1D3CX05_9EIME|nr:hypothetical protein cyc_03030 [Cyclospora cayetanensis]